MKTNHFKMASIKTKHLLKINKYLICLPVCHVTINHQRTVNMQMCYLFVKIIILKSQGYFKQIYEVKEVQMTNIFGNDCITCI